MKAYYNGGNGTLSKVVPLKAGSDLSNPLI